MILENTSRVGFGGCWGTSEEKALVLDRLLEKTKDKKIVLDDGFGYSGKLVNTKFIGEYIANKSRDKFIIIEKLPLFDALYKENYNSSLYTCSDEELETMVNDIFTLQLSTLKTEYVDCYMLHALFDMQYTNGYDLEEDIKLYKRLVPILLKLKENGKAKSLGFSCHITFERLCLFLNEVDPDNKIFDVAEVSYNTLNNKGVDFANPPMFNKLHNIVTWSAIGEKGIQYLKNKGYEIIDMMPHESGRLLKVSTAPDFIKWNDTFIMKNKDISVVLEGTTNPENIDKMLICAEEIKDPNPIPDMRIIGNGSCHCSE